MGAAGTGLGASAAMPGAQGLSPQLVAMLMRMQAGPQGGMPAAPGPTQAPTTGTPMAGFIGGGGAPQQPMMQHAPVGQPPGMGGGTLPGATAMPNGMNPQMMQMLQALKGQQSGIPANGGMPPGGAPPQLPPDQNPMAWAQNPGLLQQLLQHLQNGGQMGATPNAPSQMT